MTASANKDKDEVGNQIKSLELYYINTSNFKQNVTISLYDEEKMSKETAFDKGISYTQKTLIFIL